MELTRKQQRFVDEYLIDLNATRAAIRAGYSAHTANRTASVLLSTADIREIVAERQRERAQRTEVTQDQVIHALAAIAFCRIPSEASDACVSGVGRVRVSDKIRALELLARHLGMFKEAKPAQLPQPLSIDVAKVAQLTDEELDRGLANLNKLISHLTKSA